MESCSAWASSHRFLKMLFAALGLGRKTLVTKRDKKKGIKMLFPPTPIVWRKSNNLSLERTFYQTTFLSSIKTLTKNHHLFFLLAQVFFFHIAESNGTAKPFKKEKVLLYYCDTVFRSGHGYIPFQLIEKNLKEIDGRVRPCSELFNGQFQFFFRFVSTGLPELFHGIPVLL